MTDHRRLFLPIAALAVLLVSACSTPAAATPEPTPERTLEATPTTAAAESTPATDPWNLNAVEHRAAVGEEFTYDCPPADESRTDTVWGTDVYTDDSSVCTAAVHAGAITVEDGGEVTIEMMPGQALYEYSVQNGIRSRSYGPWGGSFAVVAY
jgi:hypothetical protein